MRPPTPTPPPVPRGADAALDVGHTEALLKTGALQSAIFNSANFSSIATDAKGVIQIFNVGAERMLGYAAGVVDPDVDVAERLDRAIAQPLHLGPLRDVGRHDDRAVADASGDLPQLRLAPGGQCETMPGGAELFGERRADAAARAGDDDVLGV